MNLYRAKFGVTNGGASWGDWEYYENPDALAADLVTAHLDIEMEKLRGAPRRIYSYWRDFFKKSDARDFRYTRIYAVERVDNDQWVAVDYSFTAPEVHLG